MENRIYHLVKNTVYNKVLKESQLDEIDWDGTFKDVKKKCLSTSALVADLQAVLDRAAMKPSKRGKLPVNKPIVHRKSITTNEEGDIDVEQFIRDITQIPKKLITQNGKLEKTSKEGEVFAVNTGLPALNGIVYDKDEGKFYQVNTCPGAGDCIFVCYARKGSFIQYDAVSRSLTQRLNLLLNAPELFETLMLAELERICAAQNSKGNKVLMRWNDAGDFFAKKYWQIAHNITKNLMEKGYDLQSYAYTKMGDYAGDITQDILVNFSRESNKKEKGKVDIKNTKASTIVKKKHFADLFVKAKGPHFQKDEKGRPIFVSDEARMELKRRLAKLYDEPIESIVYQNEIPAKEGEPNSLNLIVLPSGENDIGATRKDVKLSFLLIH